MIYKYVWQTCQQSLLIISIEQYFVQGNYTFSELGSSRKYPYPHLTPPPPHNHNRPATLFYMAVNVVSFLQLFIFHTRYIAEAYT